jgi:hypothetical protein
MGNLGLLESLQATLEQWAANRGVSVSLLGSEIVGGLAVNLTIMPESAYGTLYREHAPALGYPLEALGAELTLEEGERVEVLGLDPVGETPLLIVRAGGERRHLPKPIFDTAWAAHVA